MDIDCKVKLLEFRVDNDHQHVAIVKPEICGNCDAGICLSVCPSGVFRWNYSNQDEPVLVDFRQCIECGACRLVCPQDNITFEYPYGGYGVIFNDGLSIYPAHVQKQK